MFSFFSDKHPIDMWLISPFYAYSLLFKSWRLVRLLLALHWSHGTTPSRRCSSETFAQRWIARTRWRRWPPGGRLRPWRPEPQIWLEHQRLYPPWWRQLLRWPFWSYSEWGATLEYNYIIISCIMLFHFHTIGTYVLTIFIYMMSTCS